MDFKHWAQGLLAAVIGGVANSVTMIIVDPLHFNLFQGGAKDLAVVALTSGIVAAAMYLKQSPIPQE